MQFALEFPISSPQPAFPIIPNSPSRLNTHKKPKTGGLWRKYLNPFNQL